MSSSRRARWRKTRRVQRYRVQRRVTRERALLRRSNRSLLVLLRDHRRECHHRLPKPTLVSRNERNAFSSQRRARRAGLVLHTRFSHTTRHTAFVWCDICHICTEPPDAPAPAPALASPAGAGARRAPSGRPANVPVFVFSLYKNAPHASARARRRAGIDTCRTSYLLYSTRDLPWNGRYAVSIPGSLARR